MKRLIVFTVLIFALVSFSNAQIFVGGSIGVEGLSGSIKVQDETVLQPTATTFSFAPVVGYAFSEEFEAGIGLGIMTGKIKTPSNLDDVPDQIETMFGYGVGLFGRYYPVRMDEFGLFLHGEFMLSSISQKIKAGDTKIDGPSTFTFGFAITPGVSYDIGENVSLFTQINALNFGFLRMVQTTTTTAFDDTEIKNVTVQNAYGFGVNLNEIVTSGDITIGAIIRF